MLSNLVLLLFIDVAEEVDVLLLLPRGPDEVAVCREALLAPVLPPVPLLEHRLDDREVVAGPDPEFLGNVDLAFFFTVTVAASIVISSHVLLNDALGELIGRQDRPMEQVLHLDLQVEDELPAVKELAQGLLRVELLGDLDVDLLGNLLQLLDARIFDEPVPSGPAQRVCVVGGGDGEGVLVVLEDEADDVVDRVDRLVDFVAT